MKTSLKISAIVFFLFLFGGTALPHCDGVDGPVVQSAFKSLETSDVSYVLIWVKKEHEQTIKNAFAKTLAVRKLSPEAKEVADHHFLETLVRLHREGEGEPFTGIKAAGRDLGPVIPAADKSIESGSSDEIKNIISTRLFSELDKKFHRVQETKNFDAADIEAGREYVEAYVQYLHFAENMYKSADFTPHHSSDMNTTEEEHKH